MLFWLIGKCRSAVWRCCLSFPVRRGVVILKNGIRSYLLQGWDNKRLQNIGETPLSCQRPVNLVQSGSMGGTYPSLNHSGSTPKRNNFLNCININFLASTPPYPSSASKWSQAESWFVCKREGLPLVACSSSMLCRPMLTGCCLVCSQKWFANRSVCAKAGFV